jgi:hypothetical protein
MHGRFEAFKRRNVPESSWAISRVNVQISRLDPDDGDVGGLRKLVFNSTLILVIAREDLSTRNVCRIMLAKSLANSHLEDREWIGRVTLI